MTAKIRECPGKQQARRELLVPLHRGFDVSAERRSPSPQRLAPVRISPPRLDRFGPAPDVLE